MLQPKPVKKLTKQQKNIKDATTGNGVNSRPVFKGPNSGPRVKPTLGGAKNGKAISKAKNGKSFPDLNKDGKITKADVLKGRGVIAKSGTSMKKCKYGCN